MRGIIRDNIIPIKREYSKNSFYFDIFEITEGDIFREEYHISLLKATETTSLEETELVLRYLELMDKYKKIFFFDEFNIFTMHSFRFPQEGFRFHHSCIDKVHTSEQILRSILKDIIYQTALEKDVEIFKIKHDNTNSKYYIMSEKTQEILYKDLSLREVSILIRDTETYF